jgi:hypothetical protein
MRAPTAPLKPAALGRSYRVDVFFAPPPRERRRGAKPKPSGTFVVSAATPDLARAAVRKELARLYPNRPVRSLTSNHQTKGFVVYYNEEGS